MPSPYFRIEFDESNIVNYIESLAGGMDSALNFAAQQVERFLRYEAFPVAVFALSERAGPGFTRSYRNQLVEAIQTIPIQSVHYGEGIYAIEYDLATLGDWEHLSLGYHQGALLDTGDYAGSSSDNFASYRETTKSKMQKHSGRWLGGDDDSGLLNSDSSSAEWQGGSERRREWWVQAIIHRNPETNVWADWSRTIKWSVPIEEVPTYEQVTNDRVNAWAPFAPQWLPLEYGTRGEPVIPPVGFTDSLNRVMSCAARRIFLGAIETFKELAEQRNAVGVASGINQPYTVVPGKGARFVAFTDILQANVPNAAECLALV